MVEAQSAVLHASAPVDVARNIEEQCRNASVVDVDCRRLFDGPDDVDGSIAHLDMWLAAISVHTSIRVVIFSGLEVLEESVDPLLSTDQFRRWNKLMVRMSELGAMTIGTTSGYCGGRALQVAACCDFRISTSDARFSCTEARMGGLPGLMTYRLPTLIGNPMARKMVLAGEVLDVATAIAVGLVDYVADRGGIERQTHQLVTRLLSAKHASVMLARRLINEAHATQPDAALGHHLAAYHCCTEAMGR